MPLVGSPDIAVFCMYLPWRFAPHLFVAVSWHLVPSAASYTAVAAIRALPVAIPIGVCVCVQHAGDNPSPLLRGPRHLAARHMAPWCAPRTTSVSAGGSAAGGGGDAHGGAARWYCSSRCSRRGRPTAGASRWWTEAAAERKVPSFFFRFCPVTSGGGSRGVGARVRAPTAGDKSIGGSPESAPKSMGGWADFGQTRANYLRFRPLGAEDPPNLAGNRTTSGPTSAKFGQNCPGMGRQI